MKQYDHSTEGATRAPRHKVSLHRSESSSFRHLNVTKSIMRFASVASVVLVRTGLMLLASTPAAATTYRCTIHASYLVLDDGIENPLTPTSTERVWVAEKLQSTYNSIHTRFHTDFQMSSVKYVDLIVTPAANSKEEPMDATAISPLRLRRGKGTVGTVDSSKHAVPFPNRRYSYHITNNVSDTLGEIWDDNGNFEVVPIVETKEFALEGTVVHNQWVATWCHELQQGHKRVFQDATACAISFNGCTMKGGGAIDVGQAKHETTAVGEGIEQILMLAKSEIIAQVVEKVQ